MSPESSSTTATGSNSGAATNAKSSKSPGANTRSGKIARLPAHVQEDLNQRLQNHEPGRVILPWLNALPEVKTLLKEAFKSKPINEQNLSNWRRGGFHEWQHREKYFACFRNVARDAADIESTVGNLTEHAARLLALQFSMVLCPPVILRGHRDVPDVPPAIVNTFCKIARAISSLRRGDHAAARLKLLEQKSTLPQPPLKVNQANSSLSVSPPPTFPQAISPILHPSTSSSIAIAHRLFPLRPLPLSIEPRPSHRFSSQFKPVQASSSAFPPCWTPSSPPAHRPQFRPLQKPR